MCGVCEGWNLLVLSGNIKSSDILSPGRPVVFFEGRGGAGAHAIQ